MIMILCRLIWFVWVFHEP